MAVTVLRPTDDQVVTNVTPSGGAPNIYGRVNDNSDGTWAQHSSISGLSVQTHNVTDFTLTAGYEIRRVRARVRLGSNGTLGTAWMTLALAGVGSDLSYAQPVNAPHGFMDISAPYFTTDTNGDPWTDAAVDALLIKYQESVLSSTNSQVMELYVDVETNGAPTSVITTPADASTQTDTNQPNVTFTYTDPEFDAMERYNVRVFTAAQVGAGGFDAATSTATWESGWTLSSIASGASKTVQIGTPLTNGVTYHVYAFVSDAGSNGRYYTPNIDHNSFTVSVDPPATPSVVATLDNTRISLALTGKDNLLTQNQGDIEATPVTSDWAARTNSQAPVRYTAITPAQGAGALRVLATAVGDVQVWTQPTKAPVTTGMVINAGGKVRQGVSATGRTVAFGLRFEDATGTLVGSETFGTGVATTTSWQSATVSATAPSGATQVVVLFRVTAAGGASEDQLIDEIYARPNAATGWTRGGFVPTQTVQVQKTYDAGANWEDVRWATEASPLDLTNPTQLATLYDYEVPPEQAVGYRARVIAQTPTGVTIAGAWSTTSNVVGTIARPDSARLTAPSTSATDEPLSMDICQPANQDSTIPLPAELIYALERTNPIPRRGIKRGQVYQFTFLLEDDAEWEDFKVALDELALLWTSPFGEDVYQAWIAFYTDVSVRELTSDDMRTNQRRIVSVSGAVVDAP